MAGKPYTLSPIEIEVAQFAYSKGLRSKTIAPWFGVGEWIIKYHTTPGYKEKLEARKQRYLKKKKRRV